MCLAETQRELTVFLVHSEVSIFGSINCERFFSQVNGWASRFWVSHTSAQREEGLLQPEAAQQNWWARSSSPSSLSSCCKIWSVEGQQYWWRLTKLWTVRLEGNRAAKAALPDAVGVAGAETGCPEIDGGRTLTGKSRDGQHTETWKKQRTDTQAVSSKAETEHEHLFQAAHWQWQITEQQW